MSRISMPRCNNPDAQITNLAVKSQFIFPKANQPLCWLKISRHVTNLCIPDDYFLFLNVYPFHNIKKLPN